MTELDRTVVYQSHCYAYQSQLELSRTELRLLYHRNRKQLPATLLPFQLLLLLLRHHQIPNFRTRGG